MIYLCIAPIWIAGMVAVEHLTFPWLLGLLMHMAF